jgi:ribosome-associated protein
VDGDVRVGSRLVIPAQELRWRFSRASGPGGQGVNTTDSRVELRWSPAASAVLSPSQRERLLSHHAARLVNGDLVVVASEHRAQLRNRDAARTRLGALVGAALRTQRSRRATSPTLGSKRRRLNDKSQRGERKALRRRPSPGE